MERESGLLCLLYVGSPCLRQGTRRGGAGGRGSHPKPIVSGRRLAVFALALAGLTFSVALFIGTSARYAAAKRAFHQRASLPLPCSAATKVVLSLFGGHAAAGNGELGFSLKNASFTTCGTIGYPTVGFLDKAGKPLTTIAGHTTRDFFGSVPLRRLTVAPGARVSFRLRVVHGLGSTVGCTTAYGLTVILPGDIATLRTSIGDGVYECQMASVSPLQPGDSAYQHGA
jgi:Protein of unknown function (DUF4232)